MGSGFVLFFMVLIIFSVFRTLAAGRRAESEPVDETDEETAAGPDVTTDAETEESDGTTP